MPKPPTRRHFTSQFWLMFSGLVLSSTGTTMIWPFMLVYASEKLGQPLTTVTSLMTINSICALIAAILAGSLADQVGRKIVMVIGLLGQAAVYLLYIPSREFVLFALLMGLSGFFVPLFRVGTDAMLADMFPPEERAQAYALVRMGRNIGVALGPILGGLVLARSYNIGLMAAAGTLAIFGLITLFFLKETRPVSVVSSAESLRDQLRVYKGALQNKFFSRMIGAHTLMEICGTLVWAFLVVYLKQNFAIGEAQYSWLPTTNALMVVFLQVFVTRLTQKKRVTSMLTLGSAFYGATMLIIALSSRFWGFWAAMVVMTVGELIIAPTATTFVSGIAPEDQRGRYLGLFGLTWNLGMAVGPLSAGILTDLVGTRAPYFGGTLIGVLSVLAFLALDRLYRRENAQQK
ncbi:MAG TPA: MFS transporter [Anaerolineaceae bacterium]|jgi:MFS family permease|nr:MFS transporter [Anaerolineaceae bacterium]HOA21051.1 MFS transporter [Anaerolineaceae bacterium]HOG77080.1 MFS transporter [Anaerolineaceae bacterium]